MSKALRYEWQGPLNVSSFLSIHFGLHIIIVTFRALYPISCNCSIRPELNHLFRLLACANQAGKWRWIACFATSINIYPERNNTQYKFLTTCLILPANMKFPCIYITLVCSVPTKAKKGGLFGVASLTPCGTGEETHPRNWARTGCYKGAW